MLVFSNLLQLPGGVPQGILKNSTNDFWEYLGVHGDSSLKSKTIVSDFSWITLENKGSHTGSKKNQLFKI